MRGLICTNGLGEDLALAFVKDLSAKIVKEGLDFSLIIAGTPDVQRERFKLPGVSRFMVIDNDISFPSFYGAVRASGMVLRLTALDILFKEYPDERIVYLDTDLLFNRSLGEFLKLFEDFEQPIAARNILSEHLVEKYGRRYTHAKEMMWYRQFDHKDGYFNSGVMGFNVPACRKLLKGRSLEEEFVETIETQTLMFPDQDFLNDVFQHVHWLPESANFFPEHHVPLYLDDEDRQWFKDQTFDCMVYHLTGKVKPWQYSNNDVMQDAINRSIPFEKLAMVLFAKGWPKAVVDGLEWHVRREEGVVEPPLANPNLTPFCHAPFTVYNFRTEGYRPCCSRHATPVKPTGDWWNSPELRKFRLAMFDAKTLPPECQRCAQMTNRGPAQYAAPYEWDKFDPATGHYYGQPREVIMFLSNKCDMACEMCDSDHSDMHAKVYPDRLIPVRNIVTDSNEDIVTRFPKNEILTIMGGEPFMDKSFYDIMQKALSTNQFISILTNGNRDLSKHPVFNELIVPNKQRVHLCFSIDGNAEDQKRIRKGVKPERVIANIHRCLELGMGSETHCTISKLNLDRFGAMLEYLREEGLLTHPRFTFNVAHVDSPRDYHPSLASAEVKERAKIDIEKIKRTDFSDCTPRVQAKVVEGIRLIQGILDDSI